MSNKLICFLCCICIFCSCEYKIHENFVEIEKPDESINTSVDLNAVTDGQAILINKETFLNYSLTAFGKEIKGIQFKMGEKVWQELSPNGFIRVAGEEFSEGKYTLTCECYAPSGSGSITDQMEMEGYAFKMSWPVIIDYNMELPVVISSGIDHEGYFKLSWHEPLLSHLKLQSYTIVSRSGINESSVTIPAGNTTWSDKENVGAETVYSIQMNLQDDKSNLVWPMGEVKVPDAVKFYITRSDIKNAEVAWELPYRANVSVQINDETPFKPEEGKYTAILPAGKFGSTTDFYNVRLLLASVENPDNILFYKDVQITSPGTLHYDVRMNKWTYNRTTGYLYAQSPGELYSFSLNEQLLFSKKLGSGDWGVFSSPVSGKIVTAGGPVEVYDGKSLTLVNTIPCDVYASILGINHKDEFIYYRYKGDGTGCILYYYTLEGELLAVTPTNARTPNLSADGNYLMYLEGFDLKLIQLENYQVVSDILIPIPYEKYWSSSFHPIENDCIVVDYDDRIEMLRIPGFRKVRSIKKDLYAKLENIDPQTGNMLIYHQDYLKVLSPEGQTLFTLKTASAISPLLLGNTLISGDGYLLNIEKYL